MMTESIISRAELPDWVEPRVLDAHRFALFYIDSAGYVSEFVFFADVHRGVTLKRVRGHSSNGVTEHSNCNVPPEVFIAAGVEAMRRSDNAPLRKPLAERGAVYEFCGGKVRVERREVKPYSVFAAPANWCIVRGVYLLGIDGCFATNVRALYMRRGEAIARAEAIERCLVEKRPVLRGMCPDCGIVGCVRGAR